MTGHIFDLKEMAVHDGPGLRMTVFFKGCPLRCVWCHNPEGLSPKPQLMIRRNACTGCGACRRGCTHPDCRPFGRCLHICPNGVLSVSGREITVDELVRRIRHNSFLFEYGGGVTFSGGEPLMQPDFLLEVTDRLDGISCAIETSGYAPQDVFARVVSRMQTVYMDIKLADDALHRLYTGVSNAPILENLAFLRQSGIPAVIRTPLIPGITDMKENLTAIQTLIGDLPHELLPYNALAGAKYAMLDMDYPYDQLMKGTKEP